MNNAAPAISGVGLMALGDETKMTITLIRNEIGYWHATAELADGRTWHSAGYAEPHAAALHAWNSIQALEKEYPGTFAQFVCCADEK